MNDQTAERPLHSRFAGLARKLPHLPLATLPTPVREVAGPVGGATCKLDGATARAYGGNKVRKLEYLLGQARSHACTQVATFGAAGSNHATATAVHAAAQGLRCVNFLSRQRATKWVAGNLRRQIAAGAKIVYVDGDRAQRERQARDFLNGSAHKTWRIPMGGSSDAGTIGYVNAGMELARQIEQGDCRLPDRIYVPLGTMGTAVGIAIGLACAGLRVPLHAVRVVHETVGSRALAPRLFERTVRLLHALDASFPRIVFDPAVFVVREEFFGNGYAHATKDAVAAVSYAHTHWSLELETTYSGKALAALLADAVRDQRAPRHALFWSTYSATPAPSSGTGDLRDKLPEPLRHYLAPTAPAISAHPPRG
jgi:D-cysteine desulfhydrase